MKALFPVLLLVSLLISCSPLKKISSEEAKGVEEISHVLKQDRSIKEGPYSCYFNKIPIVSGQYLANEKTGLWNYNDVLGKLNFSGSYEKGKKQGKWVYWLKGNISCEIYYNQDFPDSIFGYHSNGRLLYELRRTGDREAKCSTYYPSGNKKETISISDWKKDGTYEVYFENGQLHRILQYDRGRLISANEAFDPSGKAIDGGRVENGAGVLRNYDDLETLGRQEIFLSDTVQYKSGKRNGLYTGFSKAGTLVSTGNYENGEKVGKWSYYKEDGSLLKSANESRPYKSLFDDGPTLCFSQHFSHDEIAEFQGGEGGIQFFLVKNIKYPYDAADQGVEGTVHVRFTISETGQIDAYKILQGVRVDMDMEVTRILELFPRWNPALCDGVPVRIAFQLPVRFALK